MNFIIQFYFSSSFVLLMVVQGHRLIGPPSLRFDWAVTREGRSAEELITLVEGDSLTRDCVAVSAPSAVVSWQRASEKAEVYQPPRFTVERIINAKQSTLDISKTIGRLYIPCANVLDSGRYVCIAQNGRRSIQYAVNVLVVPKKRSSAPPALERKQTCQDDNEEQKLIALKKPFVHMWTGFRAEASPNRAVTLVCRGRSYPSNDQNNEAAKIKWYIENGNDQNNLTAISESFMQNFKVLPHGDLLIRATSTEWDPYVSFTCIASNKYGQDRRSSIRLLTFDDS